jgi:hypothetical protein
MLSAQARPHVRREVSVPPCCIGWRRQNAG